MTTNLALGFIALLVLAGGGYYVATKHSSSAPTSVTASAPTTATQATTSPAQAGKFTGTFAELASRSGAWKCVIDSSTSQSQTSGTAYISNGKVRGDFSTKVQGFGTAESHVFADGQDVYTWSSVMPQGFKTKMVQGTGGSATSGQSSGAGQSYSYDCQPWTADASLFVLPANVTFKSA